MENAVLAPRMELNEIKDSLLKSVEAINKLESKFKDVEYAFELLWEQFLKNEGLFKDGKLVSK